MKNILFLAIALISSVAGAAVSEVDVAMVGQPRNLLRNPGFEQSKSDWTASSGTLTTTTTAANKGSGNASGSWDASASTQTLTSTVQTLPAGLYGKNIEASCNLQCASGTCTHTIGFWDGTTLTNATTITSSTSYTRTTINGIAGSSGNIGIRITSAANEPILYVDDCYLGEARNIGTVSQAQFVGSAYIPGTTGCQPSRTNTALGAFSADTDCPGPTVELNPGPATIQTTDADGPSFTVNNLGPGYYVVTMSAKIGAGATANIGLAISDGTTTSGTVGTRWDSTGGDPEFPTTVVGSFNYTTTVSKTFQIYGAASGGNSISLYNTNSASESIRFTIVRYPSTTEQVYRPDIQPASWSGNTNSISGGCSTTSTTFADPSACTSIALTEQTNRNFGTVTTAASSLPGILFTPSRSGRILVCATPMVSNSSAGADMSLRLTDGTTAFYTGSAMSLSSANNASNVAMCGIYNATANTATTIKIQMATSAGTLKIATALQGGTANINWALTSLDQSFPAPVVVNSVTSQSTGSERIERAYLTYSAGTPSVTSQSGSWISSLSDTGTGDITVNMTSSNWASAPTCFCTMVDSGDSRCHINAVPTTSSFEVKTRNSSGTLADINVAVWCMGAR